MDTIVVFAASGDAADAAARRALDGALRLHPAHVVRAEPGAVGTSLIHAAGRAGVEAVVLVDGGAVLAPDAFSALRRRLRDGASIVGGRALVGGEQRFGTMLAPARCGPYAFEFATVTAPAAEAGVAELLRGPVDIPEAGVVIFAADMLRDGEPFLDDRFIVLEAAFRAARDNRAVFCEPKIAFTGMERPIATRRAEPGVVRRIAERYPMVAGMHRNPASVRSRFVSTEIRNAGSIRGYLRRPLPSTIAFVSGGGPDQRRVAEAQVRALPGVMQIVRAGIDGARELRRVLGAVDEGHVLVTDGAKPVSLDEYTALAERLQGNHRAAVAFSADGATALIHRRRIAGAASLEGRTVGDVLSALEQRCWIERFAVLRGATIAPPDPLPPRNVSRNIEAIFLASGNLRVVRNTLDALLTSNFPGPVTAVYPAGVASIETLLSASTIVRLMPDAADPQLAVGLNRALHDVRSDFVFISADDVRISRGAVERMRAALERCAGAHLAIPRVNGIEPPDGLGGIEYRDFAEMETVAARRARDFAREATMVNHANVRALLVSRVVLETIGGFDEQLGASRFGIADFVRRAAAANFTPIVCDDVFVHRFPEDESNSSLSRSDTVGALSVRFAERARGRGFDPERDVVPLRADVAPAAAAADAVTILAPLANERELHLAIGALHEFAVAFGAADPVVVAIGLDGTLEQGALLPLLRDVLASTGRPLDETLNVRIDIVADLRAWRDTAGASVFVLPGVERDALVGLPRASVAALGARAVPTA